jgi:hypothetical protein
MSILTRIMCAFACLVGIGFSTLHSEELYVIQKNAPLVSGLIAREGISVYATLENAFVIGAAPEAAAHLFRRAAESGPVARLGLRESGCEYFLFRMPWGDPGRPGHGIEIIYSTGREAIAKASRGAAFDPSFTRRIHGLTRISFAQVQLRDHAPESMRIAPEFETEIATIVGQVSEAQYTAYIQRMQDFDTRYSPTDSCRAAELWGRDTFDAMGFETELFPFSYGGDTWYDVVGRKTGTMYPDSIYMIIGHLDAISEDPYNLAPGAEDNASGAACVLEAARVLSQYEFDCTLEFVLMTGEEQGLIGSEAYASYCFSADRNIAGVLNFDMISYAGSYGWDTNIFADEYFPEEVALADLLAQLTDEYSDAIPIRVNTSGPEYGSDHYYFSTHGFPAPFSIDAQLWGAPDWYPWYHSTDDVITHLDLDFGTEVVRGAVATLATLADPSTPPLLLFTYPDSLPTLIDPDGGTTFRVEVSAGTMSPEPGTGLLHYSTGGDFTSIPMDVVSPNVYDAVFPALECGVRVSYYVSAETVDGTIVTDPPSAPTRTFSGFSAYGEAVAYLDDFSTDLGWTGLGGSGEWSMSPATGGDGNDSYGGPDPATDHSPTSDNRLLGNDLTLSDGDYEPSLGTTYWVTSPVIDCTDFVGVSLDFWRWLGVESDNYDNAYCQAYNGSSWVAVFENGASTIDDGSWREMHYDVSAAADGNPDFKVRFGIGRTDSAWEYCGWNVDDLSVSGYSCVPPLGLAVELVPDEDPTIVPQGGAFGMTARVTNNGPGATTTDVWLGAYRNTTWYGTRLYRDVPMAEGQTRQGHFSQDVPPRTPPGTYAYVEFCGDYDTWTVADSSFFTVTVTDLTQEKDPSSWPPMGDLQGSLFIDNGVDGLFEVPGQ